MLPWPLQTAARGMGTKTTNNHQPIYVHVPLVIVSYPHLCLNPALFPGALTGGRGAAASPVPHGDSLLTHFLCSCCYYTYIVQVLNLQFSLFPWSSTPQGYDLLCEEDPEEFISVELPTDISDTDDPVQPYRPPGSIRRRTNQLLGRARLEEKKMATDISQVWELVV